MKTLLVIIGLLVGGNVFGQGDILLLSYDLLKEPFTNGQNHYIIGVNQMKSTALEIGIARGIKRSNDMGALLYSNYHICAELMKQNSEIIVGTKVGYTATQVFINYGLQIINYTDFKSNKWDLRPEIGASLLGIVDLVYGYNINLNESNINIISKHVLALRYTIGTINQQ